MMKAPGLFAACFMPGTPCGTAMRTGKGIRRAPGQAPVTPGHGASVNGAPTTVTPGHEISASGYTASVWGRAGISRKTCCRGLAGPFRSPAPGHGASAFGHGVSAAPGSTASVVSGHGLFTTPEHGVSASAASRSAAPAAPYAFGHGVSVCKHEAPETPGHGTPAQSPGITRKAPATPSGHEASAAPTPSGQAPATPAAPGHGAFAASGPRRPRFVLPVCFGERSRKAVR